MGKNLISVIVVFIFSFISVFALLHKGLPPTHDGEYHVIRFYEFDKTLRDGDWYPRWAPDLNNGYGVPLFNYVYPLPNYIALFLHLLGINFIDAFKLNMVLATIIGALFFYLWSKQFWGNLGGVVSSIFYTYSPYHFVDIYIRGSVGEVWVLGLFPAFLWAITKFLRERKKTYMIVSSLFLALVIVSHNILGLMFFVFSICYMIFLIYQSKFKKWFIVDCSFLVLLGLGVSSIFWLPAIFEAKFVTGLQIFDVRNHFPEVYQLLIPSWGSGFSGDSVSNQMSFQIGVANLLAVLLSLLLLSFLSKKESRSIVSFFIVFFAIVLFLMLNISAPIWRFVPFMNYFQFPWRLLSLEILIAPFLAGSIVVSSKKWKNVIAVIMVALAVLSGIGYAKPAYYHDRNDSYYITRSNFIDGTNSPGNYFNTIWINKKLKKEKNKVSIASGKGEITYSYIKSTEYKFSVRAKEGLEIVVNTAYFPGWVAFINGNRTEVKANNDGLISFFIPIGDHSIIVAFADTEVRMISNLIFFTSVLVTISLLLWGILQKFILRSYS